MIADSKSLSVDEIDETRQTLDAVLGIVSHDLRTPLAVVQTTTSMLLNPKYQLNPDQVREQHARIRRNVDLMNRMIGDVMDMVSLRSGGLSITRAPLNVNDAVREAMSTQESPARDKKISLTGDIGAEATPVEADRARLIQLFQNLVGTAIELSKAGDSITVTAAARGGEAHIDIAASGVAIASADLPHIFDPHDSASRKHPKTGTGLGLYVARGIVHAHGGQIRCSSAPGAGTTFTVTLPLAS